MAGSSLLTLLDDISTLLDDISVLGKVAAKKTAGVLGDDLSLNAQQVSGVRANRELPVVWGVAKGSFVNKLILVPLALIISAFASWAITPLLMLGGAYLCFEGMEKVIHSLKHKKNDPQARQERLDTLANVDPMVYERDKVKGAIRTDFILSAEIVTITLGIVAEAPLLNQVLIMAGIAILVTVGVYGIVGVIVKIDDVGYWLREKSSKVAQGVGSFLLALAPRLMKVLTIVGTLAMFLVGGGIVVHGIAPLHHWMDSLGERFGSLGQIIVPNLGNLLIGMILGSAVLLLVTAVSKLRGKSDV
ncbi:membrane protein [Salmonella enterica subsp. enterica serovar Choleraesuis]|nr:membrane protein [Salmonella enterica subsp. enterica serovar Choleraesuis]